MPEYEFKKAYKFISGLETMVNQFYSTMESLGNDRYDFVAIPPEWTTVDRILSCRLSDLKYLSSVYSWRFIKRMCLFLFFYIDAVKKMVRESIW